ncbi:hypothetical protein DUP91_26810, partial [Salmonella enterica subsp. enterica]|nr:hypothetical protein [Salmonella enterica subsp. enterica]
MDSRTGDQTAQKTMQGTIALLLSLADLADQAAGRAWCLRCYILWVMRFAEAVAWDYIAESLDGFAPPVRRMADFLPAGSRARARNLAQTFRRAARLLQAQERRFAKLTLRSPAGDWLA